MGNYANWLVGLLMAALVVWLVVRLRAHRKAWEESERDRLAIEAENEYWKKQVADYTELNKHLNLLAGGLAAHNPRYDAAQKKAFERRQSDLLDKGTGKPPQWQD